MRIALLSDVHGNEVALEAVLADVEDCGVDTFWFLGDAVGYGPQPRLCLQHLADLIPRGAPWVAGNHDLGLLMLEENPARNDVLLHRLVGNGNSGAFDVITLHAMELKDYRDSAWHQRIQDLPTWVSASPGIAIAHGMVLEEARSPFNVVDQISYAREPKHTRLAFANWQSLTGDTDCRLLCVGHIHEQHVMWAKDPASQSWIDVQPLREAAVDRVGEQIVELPVGSWSLICPGSIGQPRGAAPGHPDPRAGYAMLSLTGNRTTVIFRRVPYDVGRVQDEMHHYDYPDALIDRLALGV